METLQLREWTKTSALSLSKRQRDTLRTVFKANVQPTLGSNDRFDVTPGNTVGAIYVDEIAIVVTPKIPISQLLFMLAYTTDPSGWRLEDAYIGDAADLVSGVIGLFTNLCDRALKRGLLNGYHSVDADLYTVRGKINLAEQLRRRPGLELPLAVRFEQYDEDIAQNQLLLSAAILLHRLPSTSAAGRRSLHRILETLQNVTARRYPTNQIPPVTWTRLNVHYRPAVELARLILRLHAPDLTAGSHHTAGLAIDMAKLFEDFVRGALRQALLVSPVQFPDGYSCRSLHLDTARQVRVHPDLSLWINGQCRFIGDVKYKRDLGPGHNDDLYQLFAYATAAQLPAATLVYAEGPPIDRTHDILGVPVRLTAHHLDLSKPPPQLLDQVRDMAVQIQDQAPIAN